MSTVLVVDDSDDNRYLLQQLLRGYGYEVVSAENGAEALEMARLSPPDIVISDILMPIMDGFMLCRQWRGDDQLRAIPFVFYTATYVSPSDEEFALSVGANRVVVKAQEPEEFARTIGEIVEDYRTGKLPAPREPVAEEQVYYRQYNETLVRKLEDKALQLEQANRDLARSNSTLRQFAYVASHDLQEPLRMVACYVQLLSERYKGKLDADADEFIGYAVEGAVRMHTLIDGMRDYLSVEALGRSFERVSCESVLSKALEGLESDVRQSGAAVTSDSLPNVQADAVQLAQVLKHLIDNSIKFRSEEAPRVHVSAEKRGNEWVISVKDNGIGIEPRYSERIFEVFERLDPEAGRPGTGIGLSICRRIVERHGGRIWVESKPGMGSVFSFTLPAFGSD